MTTPTGAADEREKLIARLESVSGDTTGTAKAAADMLRADAETIRQLDAHNREIEAEMVAQAKQLAAQSAELDGWVEVAKQAQAELERVRNAALNMLRVERSQGISDDDFESAVEQLDAALAAPSAAGGEKEG